MGLTGSLAATTITQHNPQINFAVFAAAFGLLTSSFYGVFAYFVAAFAWPVILFVFDFLNFVFTFAAATAIAAGIRAHSCSNQDYLDDNNIAQGSSGRCEKLKLQLLSCTFPHLSLLLLLFSVPFPFPKVVYSVTLPDQLQELVSQPCPKFKIWFENDYIPTSKLNLSFKVKIPKTKKAIYKYKEQRCYKYLQHQELKVCLIFNYKSIS